MKTIGQREDWIFKKKVKEIVGNEYTILGNYKGIHEKILIQHNNEYCGNHKFEMRPHDFLRGQRCPYCQKHHKKTTEDIIREIRQKYQGKITLVSEYQGPKKKIKIRCNKCLREKWIYPKELENLSPCYCFELLEIKEKFNEAFKEKKIQYKSNFNFSNILFIGPSFDWEFLIGDSILMVDILEENYFKNIYYDNERTELIRNKIQLKKEFCEINNIFYLKIGFWNSEKTSEIADILFDYIKYGKMNKKRFEKMRSQMKLGSYREYKNER